MLFISYMTKNININDDMTKIVPVNGDNVWNYLIFVVNILELLWDLKDQKFFFFVLQNFHYKKLL